MRHDTTDPVPEHDSPGRRVRLASAFDYFAQVFQLVVGAALLVLLDASFITQIRAGDRFYGQAWLTFALPISATVLRLIIAAVNVRQLWREWQEWSHRHDA